MVWTYAQDLRSCPLDQGPRTHTGVLLKSGREGLAGTFSLITVRFVDLYLLSKAFGRAERLGVGAGAIDQRHRRGR